MAGSPPSTESAVPRVCILTSGTGSRMGRLGQGLNKALFPLGEGAAISEIIAQFPQGTEFVVALGYLGEQVENYLTAAHPDLNLSYRTVDRWQGPGTGPGYSLHQCRDLLEEPFYFVSCDTLWEPAGALLQPGENWVGVARVPGADAADYCNFALREGRVEGIFDKRAAPGEDVGAFIGLCFIKDTGLFWEGLEGGASVAGELQISAGLEGIRKREPIEARFFEWTDIGTLDKYKKWIGAKRDFDFSKTDEAIYFIGGRAIKFFVDGEISAKRVAKAKLNPAVFPRMEGMYGQFYSYRMAPGKTLYETLDPKLFTQFLDWLKEDLWGGGESAGRGEFEQACMKFYRDKTMERWGKFQEKYPGYVQAPVVNGQELQPVDELLGAIDWEGFCRLGIPSFIHGDLQFDNVLYDAEGERFWLIDWRQDFAGIVEVGDLYYDVAKLMGGILLNYDLIKRNMFRIERGDDGVFIDWARWHANDAYFAILREWVEREGLDWLHVNTLVGIIYLNMAPLHEPPFDEFLLHLARLQLGQGIGR